MTLTTTLAALTLVATTTVSAAFYSDELFPKMKDLTETTGAVALLQQVEICAVQHQAFNGERATSAQQLAADNCLDSRKFEEIAAQTGTNPLDIVVWTTDAQGRGAWGVKTADGVKTMGTLVGELTNKTAEVPALLEKVEADAKTLQAEAGWTTQADGSYTWAAPLTQADCAQYQQNLATQGVTASCSANGATYTLTVAAATL